jgi:DNA-binding CsgD family transcriptional regulator
MTAISDGEIKTSLLQEMQSLGWNGFTYTYTVSQEWTDPGAHYVQGVSPSMAQYMLEYRAMRLEANLTRFSRARRDVPTPFDMSSCPDTKIDHKMTELLRRHGFFSGLVIPLYGFGGALGLICLLSQDAEIDEERNERSITHLLPLQMRLNARARLLIDKAEAVRALTSREIDCLSLVAEGMTSREISGAVGITTRTVEFHIRNSLQKLHCSSRSQAASRMAQLGLFRQ